jgi:hypothetical protein
VPQAILRSCIKTRYANGAYSITSSAAACKVWGTFTTSVLAVLRFRERDAISSLD